MTTQFVGFGVVSSGVVVSSGNVLEVQSGGTADASVVMSGGTQQVDSGGFASGTVISAGGSDSVLGSDTGATIDSGGVMLLQGGGLFVGGNASNVLINSGGTLVDTSHFASFSNVVDNGTFAVDDTGVTVNVASGSGLIEVMDGGTLTLGLTGSSNFTGSFIATSGLYGGGNVVLTSAGAALGLPIDLAAPGTQLRINDTVMPSDVISGFVPGEPLIFLAVNQQRASAGRQHAAGRRGQRHRRSATRPIGGLFVAVRGRQ
jgi:fibronectin-binding autotransporter adhesin